MHIFLLVFLVSRGSGHFFLNHGTNSVFLFSGPTTKKHNFFMCVFPYLLPSFCFNNQIFRLYWLDQRGLQYASNELSHTPEHFFAWFLPLRCEMQFNELLPSLPLSTNLFFPLLSSPLVDGWTDRCYSKKKKGGGANTLADLLSL